MKEALLAMMVGVLGSRAATVASVYPARKTVANSDSVWFWFANCGGPIMTVEVQFDHSVLSQTSFPICHAPRRSVYQQGEDGFISFRFDPLRAIVWKGYRSNHDTSGANRRITVDIWQAGAESDALILGVSFMARDKIMMNRLHIARPDRADTTEIARGLVVITYGGRHTRTQLRSDHVRTKRGLTLTRSQLGPSSL